MTVVAACGLIAYFYFKPDPLIIAVYWNLLFTSLNIYWIGRLLIERRPVQFIGRIPFITESVAPADVVALEETHYMSWPKDRLRNFLEGKSELHAALHLTHGFDLSIRLEAIYLR